MVNTSNLSKYLKKQRVDYGETMNDMAEKLSVSTSFLSAVETGKRKIPSSMIMKICDIYNLDDEQKTSFFDAVLSSTEKVDISLEGGASERNAILLALASTINNLDASQIEEIKSILKK